MRRDELEAPEEWAPIPGHPRYEASTDGRVRNVITGRVLRDHSNGTKGYRRIELGERPARGGTGRRAYVHELVLEAFIGPRPGDDEDDRYEVHHRDFDPGNNTLGNLEWLPWRHNQALRARHAEVVDDKWLGYSPGSGDEEA